MTDGMRGILAAGILAAGLGIAPLRAQQRIQTIGVTTGVVAYRNIRDDVTAPASVATDEATITTVTARFAGWVEQVSADTTYQHVVRGQPLCVIYSPDIYAAEQEYLFAVRNQKALAISTIGGVAAGAASLVADARARLEQQQVPAEEIARLERTGRARRRFTVTAPETGVITQRLALPNLRVEAGARLYTLAALQPIWVVAAVNESDLGRVRVGQAASVTLDAFPGRRFAARVNFIVPSVDAASRTGQLRLVLPNADLALAPGMYGSATIAVPMGRQLVIPASGVLQSGTQALAFVDLGGGRFDPRPVQLGPQVGEQFIVRGGLRAGERIATSADFLIASQAQLAEAAGSYAPPPAGVGAASTPAPSPAPSARMSLTTDPSPPRPGANRFRVRLTDAQGAPISGANISLALTMPAMPAMGMAAMKVTVLLADQDGGFYEGSGRLGSGGSWQATLVASKGGRILARQHLTLRAGGGME